MSEQGENKAGGRQAANNVGGARLARRPGRNIKGRAADGAQQAQFYSDGSPSLKIGPTTVLVLSLGFMLSVVCLHIMGKFRAVVSGTAA